MAKIKPANGAPVPPSELWSPAVLAAVLKADRKKGDRVAALKRSGILTKDGKLAQKYKSWGNKPSRTPDASESVLP